MPRLAVVLALAGCAHAPVAPDHATGPDGESTGAETMAHEGRGYSGSGIVSYAAGDRVDWRTLTLPAGEVFDLDAALTWHPEHRADRLGVVVYDEAGRELAHARRSRPDGHTRRLDVHVPGASGTLFLLVYAVTRRDGGRFALEVTGTARPRADLAEAWVIAGDPPPLARVPSPCELLTGFDELDPDLHCNPPAP